MAGDAKAKSMIESNSNHFRKKRPKRVYNKLLNIAEDRRKLEIDLLWRRTLIFWGFTVVGFAAYAYCLERTRFFGFGAALLVTIFGVITSLVWTLVNRGSKFWQEYWEGQIDFVKEKMVEAGAQNYIFYEYAENYEKENKLKDIGFLGSLKLFLSWKAMRFSPSKIMIALSDYMGLVWSALFFMTLALRNYSPRQLIMDWMTPIILGTIAYMLVILFTTHGKDKRRKEKK